jgi:acetate kinase
MRVLTINAGSSSLKAALYAVDDVEDLVLSFRADRLGVPGGHLRAVDARGNVIWDDARDLDDHDAVMRALLEWLEDLPAYRTLDAAGHRVVHGGSRFVQPQRVTPEMMDALSGLVPLAPNHLPASISAMRTVSRLAPAMPQVACFDTAFHRSMPRVAQMYALPHELFDRGVLRYGFHGLSYEYIAGELARLDPGASGRAIVAHLGNGASVAALREGVSIDTSMGFTPSAGLVMGTRSGDLDPGILIYLLQGARMTAEGLDDLVNNRAGLVGVSGMSADMKDLLERAPVDARAAEAIELFCYRVRHYIGAYVAALGGLQTLVFTAGIGENASQIRSMICDGLDVLGIHLDPERNAAHAAVISSDSSTVRVRVMKTNEDVLIARHTRRALSRSGAHDV